jgi:CheY-like chemotaxis protein
VEYSVVGDSVNLAQRLQSLASGGETVLSDATLAALSAPVDVEPLEPTHVKGRESIVVAFRVTRPPAEAPAAAPARSDSVRVLVVDDQRPFREAAKHVVAATDGFEVVGQAESGEEAVELAAALAPDLVLMDLNLPGIDGLEATRRIVAGQAGRTAVVALSTETALATRAITSGAAMFISKSEFDPDRLVEAWRSASG